MTHTFYEFNTTFFCDKSGFFKVDSLVKGHYDKNPLECA